MEKLFQYRNNLLRFVILFGITTGQASTAAAAGSCLADTFQVPASKAQAVDVLFVVETSSSMGDVRQKILSGISDFVSKLPANSDFNIAVMLSHGSTSNLSGKLYQVESEPLVLKTSQLSNAEIQTHLEMKLMQTPEDVDSGGGEEGMFSLYNGVSNPVLLSEIQAADFFRANAALGVVFIADRRDICAVTPEGVPEETDLVRLEARIRDCEGLTAVGLTSRLSLLKGTNPVLVSGIIYTDSSAPEGKEIGYGYTDMIQLNAGTAIDIGHGDISAGLASVIALGGQTSGQNAFDPSQVNIDPATLHVTIDGQEVQFTFEGGKVVTSLPAPEGVTVVVSYCLNYENPYVGHCSVFENADQWDAWTPTPSEEDLELIKKSGNISVGAVRNLLIQNRSGQLSVDSAMAVSSIESVGGGAYLRLTGDIGLINEVSGNLRIDKAGNVGSVSNSKGTFQLNALTLGSYTNAFGNACIRAGSIGKIQSTNGIKTFIASEIEEMSVVSGTAHVYGAVINSVTDSGGEICLHNGAKVLNTTNVSGFIGVCP